LPKATSFASLSGIYSAVLKEKDHRDQMQQLKDKLGLRDSQPATSTNDTLNVFLLVKEIEELQGDNPEDKSASCPSSVEQTAPSSKKRQFPQRRPYTRGSKDDLDKIEDDTEYLEDLAMAKFSGQGLYTLNIRVRWWAQRAQARGLEPWPLTPPLIALSAALLRKGGYRSAPLYLHAAKREHIRRGYEWSESLRMEFTDCLRAVTRGLGPPRQAEPFDLVAVGALFDVDEAFIMEKGFPAHIRDVILVGSWWLLREVELAAATLSQLSFAEDPGAKEGQECGIATLLLPVSKSDVQALGKSRSLRCSCPSPLCPVGAAKRLFLSAKARPSSSGCADHLIPLIADLEGAPVSKANLVKSFRALATAAGMPPTTRITGHSCRVTGAQRMAAAGISEWRIQVFGRWGSDAVLRYIREAAIDVASHNLSGEVEGALAVTVRHFAHSSEAPQYPIHVKELALEAMGKDTEVRDAAVSQLAAEFARHCTEVQSQLRTLETKSLPTIVLCRASRRAHRVANALSTLCGWSWNSDSRAAIPAQRDWDGAWCKRCSSYADRLVGGA
jgi:hypothetical protein